MSLYARSFRAALPCLAASQAVGFAPCPFLALSELVQERRLARLPAHVTPCTAARAQEHTALVTFQVSLSGVTLTVLQARRANV